MQNTILDVKNYEFLKKIPKYQVILGSAERLLENGKKNSV